MRTGDFSQFLTPSREISARLSVLDKSPHFDVVAGHPTLVAASQYDSDMYYSTLIEVGITMGSIYYHTSSLIDGVYVSLGGWTSLMSLGGAECQVSINKGTLVYTLNNVLYKRAWTGAGFSAPVILYSFPVTSHLAIAITDHYLVGENLVVVMEVTNPSGVVFVGTIKRFTFDQNTDALSALFPPVSWSGYVSLDSLTPPTIDIAGNMIYFTDRSGNRALCMYFDGNFSTDTTSVIPLDTIDDNTFFRLNSVSDRYVAGVISRKNGYPMTVYMIGQDTGVNDIEFTYGRDMFICSKLLTAADEGFGKLIFVDGYMWYIGPDKCYRAIDTKPNQYTVNGVTLGGPHTMTTSFTSNNPSRLSAGIPRDYEGVADLKAGSVVAVEVQSNDTGYKRLGLFGIDTVTKSERSMSKDMEISATSLAMKKLSEWESDNAFDYWSQSKVWTDAKDLTQFVRSTGTWEEVGDDVDLKELNVEGLMYTVERASAGCSVRAKFMRKAGDFKVKFGMVVNYRKETMAEAAARLNKDVNTTLVEDCAASGIYVVHNEDTQKAEVYLVDTTLTPSWNKVGEFTCSIPRDTWAWLMVNFREGMVSVFHTSESLDWALLGTCPTYSTSLPADVKPWNRDMYGRAGLYVLNITPHSSSYAFGSDSTVIPLDDNSTFPSADVVLVDSEQINYASKSSNTVVGGLLGKYGMSLVYNNPTFTNTVVFGQTRGANALKISFTRAGTVYLRGIRLFVGKVGYPDDGLDLKVFRGSESPTNAFGEEVASATVQASEMTAAGGWVWFGFYDKMEVQASDRIIIRRTKDAQFPNANNYYFIKTGTYVGGNVWTYDDNNENPATWWTLQSGGPGIEIISAINAPGNMGAVYVAHDAALSASADAYNNQALACTEGSGMGTAFKITGYLHDPSTSVIYIESNPGLMFDETSKFKIVPALLIGSRAVPTAHSAGKVEIYRAAPLALVGKAGYFSREPDLSLATMVNKLAKKAGIYGTVQDLAYPSSFLAVSNTVHFARRNIILKTCIMHTPTALSFVFRKTTEACIIRCKPASDSEACRPPNPKYVGHPFRSMSATF